MDDELQDWVVLHHHHHHHNSDSDSVPLDEIDSAGNFIHTDYFSLDSPNRYAQDLDDNKSAISENPSWIDPGFEDNPARYLNKESTEFWSDSSSDRSEDRNKFTDFLVRNQMEFYKGIRDEKGDSTGIEAKSSGNSGEEEGAEGVAKVQEEAENDKGNEEHHMIRDDQIDNKTSHVVWWKMPMEFVKYFVFRMSPVWSLSVAAAFMGFVILGRRLYKMKKKNKTRGLQIKVAVDDKKVSQVMSRAARLNEAFSVVKRVPAIRPSLPAIGVTTWPAMTIR